MSTARELKLAVEAIRKASPEAILKASAICDGHGIFAPEAFTEAGLPQEAITPFIEDHESNFDNPKETISDQDGNEMDSCKGVYGLRLLTFICSSLGVEYEGKLGRGSQARAMQEALNRKLGKKNG